MLYNFYQFAHNSIGVHFWDLPALITTVALIVVLLVHSHNQKKRDDNFDKERNKRLETLANEAAEDSAHA